MTTTPETELTASKLGFKKVYTCTFHIWEEYHGVYNVEILLLKIHNKSLFLKEYESYKTKSIWGAIMLFKSNHEKALSNTDFPSRDFIRTDTMFLKSNFPAVTFYEYDYSL